jgi:hypothetical protein
MFHRILKQHEVHHGVVVVVDGETLIDVGEELLVGHDVVKTVLAVHAA